MTGLTAALAHFPGIAVVVTLLYLAYQIRQTAQIERAAGQRDLLAQLRSWVELTACDPALFDVLRRGTYDWDALPPAEKGRFHSWALSLLLLTEQALYVRADRCINEGSFRGIEQAALAVVATPGGLAWWRFVRSLLGRRPAGAPHWSELHPHWSQSG